jgi:hypothetical protein
MTEQRNHRTKLVLWAVIACIGIITAIGGLAAYRAGAFDKGINDVQQAKQHFQTTVSDGFHLAALASKINDDQAEKLLILFQNDDELRPTGGFITAFGEATVVNGTLQDLRVIDSRAPDKGKPSGLAMPEGLAGNISTDGLTLRDSNWDVDFETTAASIARRYQEVTGFKADLVVAFNSNANERILASLGGVTFSVSGTPFTVDAHNVTQLLEHYTDIHFGTLGLNFETRKTILAEYANALLPKVHDYAIAHPTKMVGLVRDLISNYDVQIWSANSEWQNHLLALDTAQNIESFPKNDALAIVDANVASYKTDPYIEQSAHYTINLDSAQSTLVMTYKNTADEGQLTTVYRDFVRIYAPRGSVLLSSDGLSEVTATVRHNRTVFSGWVTIPTRDQKTITLNYRLAPEVITGADTYSLLLERQPGGRIVPITVDIVSGQGKAIQQTDTALDRRITVESIQTLR